ncbi:MAG TPA: DNA translocase FtsK 4TM domain-containing protein, partial [Kofleriaceae bacterium]|nr:DNA translocase FtsK 4TM domain-containing protein [Kofleriaceae bacterium]
MAKPTAKKASAALPANRRTAEHSPGRGREITGIVALGASVFILLAMIALSSGGLFMGPFGRSIASMVYGIAGLGSYVLVGLAIVGAVRSLMERRPVIPWEITAGVGLGVLSVAVLLHLAVASYRVGGIGPGGALGEHLAEVLRALISTAGTALLATISLVIAVIVATPLRMRQVLAVIGRGLATAGGALADAARTVGRFCADVTRAILPERGDRDYDEDDDEDPLAVDEAELDGPPIVDRAAPTADFVGDTERVDTAPEESEKKPRRKKKDDAATGETELPAAAATVALAEAKPDAKADAKPERKRKKDAAVVDEGA